MSKVDAAKKMLNDHGLSLDERIDQQSCTPIANWDMSFLALANADIDITKVYRAYSKLLQGQWSTGLLPHVVYGCPKDQLHPDAEIWQSSRNPDAPNDVLTSGIAAPPIHGAILWQIYQNHQSDTEFHGFVKELYPRLLASHFYFYKYRDPMDNGLITIRSPLESDMRDSPLWDEPLDNIDSNRDSPSYWIELFAKANYDEDVINASCPFQVIDPSFNSILAWSNECLIELGYALDLPSGELFENNELTLHSMNELLWDESAGLYHGYDVLAQRRIDNHTAAGFMPMIAGAPDIDQVLAMVRRAFGDDFRQNGLRSIPSYSLSQTDVDVRGGCRGALHLSTNWLLIQGLRRYDMDDLADIIQDDSLCLVDQYGHHEYYDPRKSLTDNGLGTNSSVVTAALYLNLLKEDF